MASKLGVLRSHANVTRGTPSGPRTQSYTYAPLTPHAANGYGNPPLSSPKSWAWKATLQAESAALRVPLRSDP